ncbi:myo-inositol-1(or 4)-monophosphatase [Rhizobium wenxiniae]|uniref:Inositol-1-monophosphatase n=1 Tax=Rhizobium wenxiniae TaxID=1737357 RepID=A0A7X0D3W7_9HYPH|nr:inositol monophosphatase family protein [Rhizobium wenxiniae]MBB6165911.1 myo-inositol-1(or 4)-monophosphatase [Rhizobium wenxiniae]
MPMLDIAKISAIAESAARKAGHAVVSEWMASRSDIRSKGGTDIVSAADILSERIISSCILGEFPAHRILSEEDSSSHAYNYSGPLWIIDPIDGTANYVRGHPYFGISVAFAMDGKVLAGCVHAPALDETFRAVRGEGATFNGTRIEPSSPTDLLRSVVSTGFPHDKTSVGSLSQRVDLLLRNCQDIRRSASPVLDICYVGMGRLDAHTESLFPWDVAAAGLVAMEAGAARSHLTSVEGDKPLDLLSDDVLFSAPGIHQQLLSLLRSVQNCVYHLSRAIPPNVASQQFTPLAIRLRRNSAD